MPGRNFPPLAAQWNRLGSARDFSYKKRTLRSNELAKQYTSKIRNAPSWEAFLAVIDDMEQNGVEPDAIHFNAAITVCAKQEKDRESSIVAS